MSVAASLRWPPLTSTLRGPSARMRRAASSMSASLSTAMSASAAASWRFGVTTSASGSASAMSAARASGWSSGSPDLAIITGSSTRGRRPCADSRSATARMIGAVESMPIFTASAPMSESTASICWATNSGGTLNTPCTPTEFWAVSAVSTEVPKTRNAENVLRSAWMPAPPPESDPAIVSAVGTVICSESINLGGELRPGKAGVRMRSVPDPLVGGLRGAEDAGTVEAGVEVGIDVVGLVGHEVVEGAAGGREAAVALVHVRAVGDGRGDGLVRVPGDSGLDRAAVLPRGRRAAVTERAAAVAVLVVDEREDRGFHVAVVRRAEGLDQRLAVALQADRRRHHQRIGLGRSAGADGARERDVEHAEPEGRRPRARVTREVREPAEPHGRRGQPEVLEDRADLDRAELADPRLHQRDGPDAAPARIVLEMAARAAPELRDAGRLVAGVVVDEEEAPLLVEEREQHVDVEHGQLGDRHEVRGAR